MRTGTDPLPRRLVDETQRYVVTMSKRVYVDFVVNATGAEAAIAHAHHAADYTTIEHALGAGIAGYETDWAFERVEVEGDDDPPSAMAVAA